MATLDDNVLERLRELDRLRHRARDLRQRGRKALAKIPLKIDIAKLKNYHDLSAEKWVSGSHPIDIALLVRVLNNEDLNLGIPQSDLEDFRKTLKKVNDTLEEVIKSRFETTPADRATQKECDAVPVLTAARVMHALVSKSTTVFSAATMICYYQIIRELYLATFPNWIIGAARAGDGGRVSAFVTGECVRAISAFRSTIKDTITFFKATKKLCGELERLEAIPNMSVQNEMGEGISHWDECRRIEVERIVLDWYAANNLGSHVIALDLFPSGSKSPVFKLDGQTTLDSIKTTLQELPELLMNATDKAVNEIGEAEKRINDFRKKEEDNAQQPVEKRMFDATTSAHELALGVVKEALKEAQTAMGDIEESRGDLQKVLDKFIGQYHNIYKRIGRVIEPAKRYIQDVLNRELARAANSSRFDAGELLFAAASYGAITRWKQNAQLTEARRLLTDLLPEDGRFQTSHPIHSDLKGSQLMPIAFEMTRCYAQLMRKDFGEDLDDKVVRRLLNLFDDPIHLEPGDDDTIGWNFGGAPESQKPSIWVTAVGVFALDRISRMLDERINATVLRHFNVDWPDEETDPWAGILPKQGGKLSLSSLINTDYELHAWFKEGEKGYKETPSRMENVSLAIRLQQMRAHLTRAVLPPISSRRWDKQSGEWKKENAKQQRAYNAILYGPPGTGKTTLAEALATTAKAPMVRLSPSDLMVQGTDVIESRARAIFESLSMLTRAVIFLDEFEPVVRTRTKPKDAQKTKYAEQAKDDAKLEDGKKSEDDKKSSEEISDERPQDPPEFRFLVTGMLPKLTKLNKAAANQSAVYLLATNQLSEIDAAAKREERFDLHLPIYNPDPMSRLLVLFYRLIELLEEKDPEMWRNSLKEHAAKQEFWRKVKSAIDKTEQVSAQSLAKDFFSTKKGKKTFLTYIIDSLECPEPTPDQSKTLGAKTPVEVDIELQLGEWETYWKESKRNETRPR